MAPEMLTENPSYLGCDADLFAAVAILFVMYSQAPPFSQNTSKNDPLYKLILSGKKDLFWKSHEKGRPAGYFSDDFKDLIDSMF